MGPPRADLAVHTPAIDRFGGRELGRVVTIGLVMVMALLRVLPRKLGQIRQRWSVLAAGAVVDGFETLGPTFVKLGQLVASSPGLFPTPRAEAWQRCLDEVPPFPSDTVHRLIREDLGRSPAQLFRSFDDRPLSAASIAQIHACVLPDGRDAVVKLQRPDIARRMNTDLRILHKLALVLARTKAGSRFNAPAIIEDLHQVTNQELNFALEAHRQATFRDHIGAFGDNRWVTAPEVYWDYCGPHMICMERMVGIPMDAFDTIRERDLDDGRCSFLDFVIMGELDGTWKQFFSDLLITILFDRDYTRIARAFRRVEIFPAAMDISDEMVGQQLKMVLDPLLDQSVSGLNLGELLKQAFDIAESLGATAPREMVLIAKQLLYLERYTKALVPDYLMVKDPFLVRNIFPAAAVAKAADLGIQLPQ